MEILRSFELHVVLSSFYLSKKRPSLKEKKRIC